MTGTTDSRVLEYVGAQGLDGASLSELGGRTVLTMMLELPHPRERVWTRLTEPEQLGAWSPVVPDRAFSSVGPAAARETAGAEPVDAEVLVCDPPRELVHRWGTHILSWTLAPTAGGCCLTLEHTFDEVDQRGSLAAGWHLCLAVLAAVLDGHGVERVVGRRALDYGWESLKDRYEAVLVR